MAAYGLSRGVARINEKLPDIVYALLSGLNSATVGVIVLAAVQLSQKAITDKITRILVFFGAAAGVLYNALWYFPVLMVVGGITAVIWDRGWIQDGMTRVRRGFQRRRQRRTVDVERSSQNEEKNRSGIQQPGDVDSKETTTQPIEARPTTGQGSAEKIDEVNSPKVVDEPTNPTHTANGWIFSWRSGLAILAAFFALFITIMVLRGVLDRPPKAFSVFANLFLAGKIPPSLFNFTMPSQQ